MPFEEEMVFLNILIRVPEGSHSCVLWFRLPSCICFHSAFIKPGKRLLENFYHLIIIFSSLPWGQVFECGFINLALSVTLGCTDRSMKFSRGSSSPGCFLTMILFGHLGLLRKGVSRERWRKGGESTREGRMEGSLTSLLFYIAKAKGSLYEVKGRERRRRKGRSRNQWKMLVISTTKNNILPPETDDRK